MKRICLGLLMALALRAENAALSRVEERPHTPKRVWIRRATLAAGCVASIAFDSWSTRRVASAGGVEQNGILADGQGSPRWGRIVGMKVGFCGASLVMQETHLFGGWKTPTSDWTWTGANAATTGIYTWVGFHNLGVAHSLTK